MGGSSHHHHHHHKPNNNGGSRSSTSSGKPYGLMLLLAFGAALLGVMVLHKLRERRIFGLLVKEKDSQLVSLQFLLQKEKEYGKEVKMKNEEMKARLYSLRGQKMELERRVLEMRSTIDSLKDEQKALELALEDKQNEINTQREQIDAGKENPRMTRLKEMLKLEEAEIEDLRGRLDNPVKVASVSTDNDSLKQHNLTNTLNVARNDIPNNSSSSKEAGRELSESSKFIDDENLTRVVDGSSGKGVAGTNNSMEITVGHLENQEIVSQDEGFKNGDGDGIERKGVDYQGTILKPGENSSDVKDVTDHTITRKREMEKLENSEKDVKQEVQAISKGGMQLEMQDPGTRMRGKHAHQNRTKGKRWRTVSKTRVSENNAVASLRSRRFHRLEQDELRSRIMGKVSNEVLEKSEGTEKVEEARKAGDAKLVMANPEDAEHIESTDDNAYQNKKPSHEMESSSKSRNSPDREVPVDRSGSDIASNVATYAGKQVEQPQEEARGLQQNLMISSNNSEQENVGKPAKVNEQHQTRDNREAANEQDSDTKGTNGAALQESSANLEGEGEGEGEEGEGEGEEEEDKEYEEIDETEI